MPSVQTGTSSVIQHLIAPAEQLSALHRAAEIGTPRVEPPLTPDSAAPSPNSYERFQSANIFDPSGMRRFALEAQTVGAGMTRGFDAAPARAVSVAAAPSVFQELHPAAQGLQFSETKGASDLAYDARQGEVYLFPDGKAWRVERVEDYADSESGFRAIVLRPIDPHDRRAILAYAGTDSKSWEDWGNNLGQGFGFTPEQYDQAAGLAREVGAEARANGEALTLTGHSLGGGLASYAAVATGAQATAINSAPLAHRNIPNDDPTINDRVTQYYVPGEILTDLDHENPFDARPGTHVAVPGAHDENPPWYVQGLARDLYQLRQSIKNHDLGATAVDVPPPQRTYFW